MRSPKISESCNLPFQALLAHGFGVLLSKIPGPLLPTARGFLLSRLPFLKYWPPYLYKERTPPYYSHLNNNNKIKTLNFSRTTLSWIHYQKPKFKKKLQLNKYEFSLQGLDCGIKHSCSGDPERPRGVQVEFCYKVNASTCQEQYQVLLSGQEALCSIFFCYF